MNAAALPLAGLTPLTTLDYPGLLACVIFTQGCPLRCGYCHNPELVRRESPADAPDWNSMLDFLQRRVGLLQGVVFSGGEPTIHPMLQAAIEQARALGFQIGLHTSGLRPDRLQQLLPHLNWVGLDIKALPEHYTQVCGRPGVAERALQSLRLLQEQDCAHEVRVTLHPLDIDLPGISRLLDWLAAQGVRRCALQPARFGQCLEPAYASHRAGYITSTLEALIARHAKDFEQLLLR